ncbi:hypothetical protein [Streptomyces sp. NPDC002779]|uniref:hypothetical protein n=1 Tax=Streptomyces sp. NPDC002779 TaxID=3364664 RepID=UPI003683073E
MTPCRALWVGALLPVSATYDAALPPPEDAEGFRAVIDLSQAVGQAEADRFEVRLGLEPTFAAAPARLPYRGEVMPVPESWAADLPVAA